MKNSTSRPPRHAPSVSDTRVARAQFLRLAAGACASLLLPASKLVRAASTDPDKASMKTRPAALPKRVIPSSGELLPVIGCGTYIGFDVAPESAEYVELSTVLTALFGAGGSVLDSSPMYGQAEQITGRLLAQSQRRDKAFLATKVWTSGRENGIAQMERSMRLLASERIDLMQIHNLLDWRTHMATLRDWKARGRIRYLGVTHYTAGAYADLEAVMRSEPLDFVQINYSVRDREAERRILPLAAERGMAVLVNTPFGGGGLLRALRNEPLPQWAVEIGADSWAQVLLKFVLSHSAVTCAIPGSSRALHMAQNAGAAMGPLPDEKFWATHLKSIPV